MSRTDNVEYRGSVLLFIFPLFVTFIYLSLFSSSIYGDALLIHDKSPHCNNKSITDQTNDL